jgi:cytochrome c biogenesis protein
MKNNAPDSNLVKIIRVLSSMPVAISMLCLVALSSVIGTILQQQQNYVDYVNRFGSWWTDIFIALSLNQIYASTWFLLILAFLCISTSACIIRSWPPFYRQIKKYQLNIKKKFLLGQSFSTTLEIHSKDDLLQRLKKLGYRSRVKIYSETDSGDANQVTLIAAKKNAYQKWGYLLTHVSVLVISIGGLFDGNLPLKWRLWTGENQTLKSYETTWQDKHIIDESNPSFRANLWVAEGDKNNFATIRLTDGILGQRLPFEVELKKFHIDYYSSGMPKSFISDVILRSKINKEQKTVQLKVNQPAEFMGYRIYQASFEDGGSDLDLKPIFWRDNGLDFKFDSKQLIDQKWRTSTQDKPKITSNNQSYQFEISEFKALNVHRNTSANTIDASKTNSESENTSTANANQTNEGVFSEGSKFKQALTSYIDQREFKNIGPSIQYKLRGDDQKAIEYHSYMLPIEVDGYSSFMIGMREKNDQGFQYVYIPSFEGKSIEWQSLSQYFFNDQSRAKAIAAYAKKYPEIESSIIASLEKASAAFVNAHNQQKPGLMGLAEMVQSIQNQNEQKNMGPILMRMFQGMLWEAWQQSRTQRNLAILPETPENTLFAQKALTAISDVPLIKTPLWFELKNFEQKNASVLQITRSPGQFWVYIGCVMLVIGVFMMLFMQELRLWIYLEPRSPSKTNTPLNTDHTNHLSDTKQHLQEEKSYTAIIAMAKARHLHAQRQSFNELIQKINEKD